ncbi:MAG: zeta toxin family protein [Proteobacteria bacterium]|nr:zeta toxin family protein [Pseudomonadota bacterium]
MSGARSRGLTPQEQQELAAKIAEPRIEATETVDEPTAVLTGGQPGAGKSHIVKAIAADYQAGGGIVRVDPDDIRPQLPYMRPIIEAGSDEVPEVANLDAGTVAYQVVQLAKAAQRNVLVDGTLQNTDRALGLAAELRDAGYRVEVHGMAVYPDLSHARTYARREADIANSTTGFGRGVTDEFHRQAVAGFAHTVKMIYDGGHVDRIALYDEKGRVIYDVKATNGVWDVEHSPHYEVRKAHLKPSEEAKAEAAKTWALAVQAMRERRADADTLAKVEVFKDAAEARVAAVGARPGRSYTGAIRVVTSAEVFQEVDGALVRHAVANLYGPGVRALLQSGNQVEIKYPRNELVGQIHEVGHKHKRSR